MIDKADFTRICNRIDSYRDEMIKMQTGLTALPALSPINGGDGEAEKGIFLKQALNRFGFDDIREINAPDDSTSLGFRPNIFAKIKGKNPERTAWILTHLDIVPPGELSLWAHDPYQAYVNNGRLYGRGVVDNQQDMVASVFAARAFLDENIIPAYSAGLAFVSDEETGSRNGLQYVLTKPENPFKRDDLLIVPDAGSEDGTMVEIAEKSILWLKCRTIGKQCHGSRPAQGNNAFLAASHLVVRLNDLHRAFPAHNELFQPPASTFQPTKKEPNVPNVNTIPGDDVFYMDCRILPEYPLTQVREMVNAWAKEIEIAFGVSIEISAVSEVQAPSPTCETAPVVQAIKAAVRDTYKLEAVPMGIGGSTVAAYFRREGYPAAVWSRNSCVAHQPNEYCIIDDMIGNAKVFAHIFLQESNIFGGSQ